MLGVLGGVSGKGLADFVLKSVKIPQDKHVYSLYHVTNQLEDYMYKKGNCMFFFKMFFAKSQITKISFLQEDATRSSLTCSGHRVDTIGKCRYCVLYFCVFWLHLTNNKTNKTGWSYRPPLCLDLVFG